MIDVFENHFGNNPAILTEPTREAVDTRSWKVAKENLGQLGLAAISALEPTGTTTPSLPSPDVSYFVHLAEHQLIPLDSRTVNYTIEGLSI